MGKAGLSVAHTTGFYNEKRPAGVEKNSRSSLRRMRYAYCEDCGAQNEELALLVEEFNGLGRAHFLHANVSEPS